MIKSQKDFLSLTYKLLYLLFVYFLCRIAFVFFNQSSFNLDSTKSIYKLFFYGIRFDISAIFMSNAIFILLSIVPFPFFQFKPYQKFLKYLFIVSNCLFVFLNLVDIAYFPFIKKRMQFDGFGYLNGEKGTEFYTLIPTFLWQYWYLIIIFLAIVYSVNLAYDKTTKEQPIYIFSIKNCLKPSLYFIVITAISIIAMRGGLQTKPLNIINANEMGEVKNAAVLLNTPFSVIKTYGLNQLTTSNEFTKDDLKDCFNGIHKPKNSQLFDKQNIVLIIVESLSNHYLSYFNGDTKTPFLDSLLSQSLVFPNGFANSTESIQGIPAILASIPSWQDEAFIQSPYATNKITSFASLLKAEGYQSSFFHGGKNGTMGFNAFAKAADFEQYYGKDEYRNDNDFDGNWGIWDEPFLQFAAKKLDETRQPFISSIFTLNTHHPFTIPEKYKDSFKNNKHPMLSCVQYTDVALSLFFEKARKMQWFKNTLFVITADHASPTFYPSKRPILLSNYNIPIVFYKPDNSLRGTDLAIANQIDILPTVLGMLHYPKPYFSFGSNLFDKNCVDFSINYNAGIYQYIDSSYCYQYDGEKGVGLYQWKTDKLLNNNLLGKQAGGLQQKLEINLKKKIQVFNNTLEGNGMDVLR